MNTLDSKRHLARSNGGFTLLAMLVVLVLIVSATSIVMPAMLNSGGSQLRSGSRIVVAGLQRAREFAINQQNSAALIVDVNQRWLKIPGQSATRSVGDELKLNVFTARSELLNNDQAGIRFFPDGSSSGGRITLSRGGRQAYVDVDWLTGEVRVHSGEPLAPTQRLDNRVQL